MKDLNRVNKAVENLDTVLKEEGFTHYLDFIEVVNCFENNFNFNTLLDLIICILDKKRNDGKLAYYLIEKKDIDNRAGRELSAEQFDDFNETFDNDVDFEIGEILQENNNFNY